MQPIFLQSLTAFLCIASSLIMIRIESDQAEGLPAGDRTRPIQPTHSHRSKGPADELEAQMHFYMQPTAREVNQREQLYGF